MSINSQYYCCQWRLHSMLCNFRQPLKCAHDSYTRGTWAEFVLVPVPAPRFFSLLQLQKSARTSMPLGEPHLCNQPGNLNLTRRVFLPQQIDSQLTREMHLAWVSHPCRLKIRYFKQEPIQHRFDFSDVLYFAWPNQPSSGTMRVYIELLLCTYIYI